jgi:DNA-binding NtrC family response regulator
MRPDLVLMDVNLSGRPTFPDDDAMDGVEAARRIRAERPLPVVFVTAYSDADTIARVAETGALGYVVKPVVERDLYAAIEVALHTHALQQRRERPGEGGGPATEGDGPAEEADRFHDLVGASPRMRDLYAQIRSLGPVDATVHIRGETGTGKELVARALHAESSRAAGPFVAVNCAALQPALAGSLLFGHRRGAFTGAIDDRPGYFEAAAGGTLFLDEIGDLPLDVQQQLLRVLEERRVVRLGETREREVDVRIVSATHRPLEADVREGRFRADLLYRIRVARLDVPPLRDRCSDLPLLVRTLRRRAEARMKLAPSTFSEAALRHLLAYDWPGNVRELRNVVESALLRAAGSTGASSELSSGPSSGPPAVVQPADLPPEVVPSAASGPVDGGPSPAADPEAERIRSALRETGGNRSAAATLLGISRSTLYRRLRELSIG